MHLFSCAILTIDITAHIIEIYNPPAGKTVDGLFHLLRVTWFFLFREAKQMFVFKCHVLIRCQHATFWGLLEKQDVWRLGSKHVVFILVYFLLEGITFLGGRFRTEDVCLDYSAEMLLHVSTATESVNEGGGESGLGHIQNLFDEVCALQVLPGILHYRFIHTVPFNEMKTYTVFTRP